MVHIQRRKRSAWLKLLKKISFIERWRDEGRRTATKIKTRMRTNDCSAAKEKG